VCVCDLYRHARRQRLKQQQLYAAIAADKLYSDVAPADDDYAPMSSVSTAYIKTADRRSRPPPHPTDYTHVWQLPLPQQPHDDVTTSGCVTSSGAGGSIDSRYYVLDHNHQTGSIIPTNDDIQ